jgi:PAS domain S-box-containing protein
MAEGEPGSRSGRLLSTLFRHAPVGFAVVDRAYRYQHVNEALAASHALDVEAHLGRTVEEIVPQFWPSAALLCERALAGETILNAEIGGVENTGQRRHWLVSYYPLEDDGEIVGVGLIVNDISARRRAEESLRVRSDLYAMLSRTNAAVSQAGSAEELYRAVCAIAVETGHFRFAWVGVRSGDRIVPIASAGEDAGYLSRISITVAPEDPRSLGPTGQSLLTGRAIVVNDFHASSMTSPWHAHAAQAGFAASAAFPLFERAQPVATLTLYAGEKGFFTDELVATLGETTQAISLALDGFAKERERAAEAAARRSLELQLAQAQKMEAVGRLAAGVAHDFNNLLSVILGYGSLALERAHDHEARESIEEILRAGKSAADITRQLLAFSRQRTFLPAVIDVGERVRALEKMLRRLLGEDVELVIHAAGSVGHVRADPTQIEQLVVNLAVNARDAMPRGGRLSIEVTDAQLEEAYAVAHPGVAPGPYVLLCVTDTGVGMDEATRDRIFEPFFTTKDAGKGTGLGLSTVFGIVQQCGGHVHVDTAPGRGTSFWVHLPRVEAETTEAPSSRSTGASTKARDGETILLVEDAEPLRALNRAVLRRGGYVVLEARDGLDALRVAEAHGGPIHLLLTDVVMPRLGGLELAERLSNVRPTLRTLFVSGYSDQAVATHDGGSAAARYLQKPVSPQVLLEHVREALEA